MPDGRLPGASRTASAASAAETAKGDTRQVRSFSSFSGEPVKIGGCSFDLGAVSLLVNRLNDEDIDKLHCRDCS